VLSALKVSQPHLFPAFELLLTLSGFRSSRAGKATTPIRTPRSTSLLIAFLRLLNLLTARGVSGRDRHRGAPKLTLSLAAQYGDPAFTKNVTELQQYYLTDPIVEELRSKILDVSGWLPGGGIRAPS
jgi:hypothetical protein